jgi:L-ascorbate metabolism protein UlaG (beta-lactamase superfamily)
MEIVWYGHSCFRINERGKAAVVGDLMIMKWLGIALYD